MKRWICGALAGLLMTAAGVPALAAETAPEEPAPVEQPETLKPDEPGTVSWENLRSRIEAGSLNAQILGENINTIQAMDYDDMLDRLRPQLNNLATAQWYASLAGNQYAADTVGQAYHSLRETFDAIWDGDMQKDNADAVRQLEEGRNQVVAGGQSLYLAILGMEQSAADGARSLAALDRSLTELRLRQRLGQVSALTVQELEQTRATVASQLQTRDATITTYKIPLQTMRGVEPDGKLALLPLPELDMEALDGLDCEAGLETAKAASLTLYNAKQTLDDAKKEWQDTRYTSYRYEQQMADHTWNAAQITYQSAVQSFETSFRSLYRAIQDQRQVVEEKEAAAAYQARALESAQAQYGRGRISHSALQSAQDSAAAAQSELEGALRDLFSAFQTYRNAVEFGIVN